jgi:hypothetical protein
LNGQSISRNANLKSLQRLDINLYVERGDNDGPANGVKRPPSHLYWLAAMVASNKDRIYVALYARGGQDPNT